MNGDINSFEQAKLKAAAHHVVFSWMLSRIYRPTRFFLWLVVGMVASWVAMAGLWPAAVVLIGSAFVLSALEGRANVRRLETITDLVADALVKYPKGLDNAAVAMAVLNEADVARENSASRIVMRVGAAAWRMCGPGGQFVQQDCRDGHPVVCVHRMDADALGLWRSVAASVGADETLGGATA
jgi:hypothetical protein